ncbi:MAG: lipocalin-like domain-containing protein [Muribaculaceae bacterium]|nr:lipocalin-like domain-containing protein [Muribaculaceae bacterium]
MKKYIAILLLSLLFIAAPACRRASDNGKIDGFWKITEIRYTTDNSVVNPPNRYIGIQLELLQLNMGSPGPELTAVLNYHKGDAQIGADFRYNPTDAQLAQYGFVADASSAPGTKYCILDIEHVSSSRMVLRSPIAVITCRKY